MPSPLRFKKKHAFAALALLFSAGCSGYHPLPLATRPDLLSSMDQVVECVPPGAVNLSDGLSMTEVAVIAASLNPDLRAVRMKRNVARAEAFSAGLLPDPQLNASIDHPTSSAPGFVNAFTAGATFDLRSLFTRPSETRAAAEKAKSVDKDILWQEWQVIQQARNLYATKYFTAERLRLLDKLAILDKEHEKHSQKALAAGDATLEQASADLAALMDAQGQLRAKQRDALQTDRDLDALLGLAPGVSVPALRLGNPDLPTDAAVQQALDTVARRRPDLVALQEAYDGQEASLYAAVLKQFPSIMINFNGARDTSNVHTAGLGVTVDLPIFNGSKGEIAVQSATRAQLQAEYQARLDQAHAEITTLWQQTRMIRSQMAELHAQLPQLEAMLEKAQKSYKAGDFPVLNYIALQSGLLSKEMEYLDLRQSLWANRIALDTLLAWPVVPETQTE